VTNNVLRRIYEHKNDLVEGFTQQYKVHTLVFYKFFDDMEGAITYEKRLKKWKPRKPLYNAGALAKYALLVGPASQGAITHKGPAKR
jgi:predicted GIY-YIG superfamily endonuclease